MAEARARLRPSTVISTVVPRAMPRGETALRVGGVVRLPAAKASGAAQRSRANLVMRRLVEFELAVEEGGGEGFAVGGEFEAEGPIGLVGDGPDFGEVGGAEEFDGAIGGGGGEVLPVGRPGEFQDGVFVGDQGVLQGV